MQICNFCLHMITGDIRLTPFYDVEECMRKVKSYVVDLNQGSA